MTGLSVIVPAFNAAATLGATLASIRAQTRPPDEILVVDDGSTDDTPAIAAGLPGVQVLRRANGGVAAALNHGIAAASGDLLACLDADDLWTADALAVHAGHLAAEPACDASVGRVEEFVCPTLAPDIAARFQPRPAQAGWLSGATVLRRSLVDRSGPFDAALRFGFWIDWVDRARRAGGRFDLLPALVLRRRLHPGSLGTDPRGRNAGLLDVARRALARRRP